MYISNASNSSCSVHPLSKKHTSCTLSTGVEFHSGSVKYRSLSLSLIIIYQVLYLLCCPYIFIFASCIGINGSSIQKIVAQLGTQRDKEKIDIISYSPNEALFIIDAVRPASVIKIFVDSEAKEATVIVPDGQLSLAIGRKGANARLASHLTGYKIDIKEEHDANELGLAFKSVESIKEEEKIRAQKEKYEKYVAQVKAMKAEESSLSSGVEKAKPHQILDEEVKVEQPKVEETPVVEEPKVEETPVVEEKKVRITTDLESLEAKLESDQKREAFKATQKTSKRPRKITEEEVEREVEEVKPEEQKQKMSIYTEEELASMEEEFFDEEESFEDEEIDYDEYDQYYDDDEK